MHIHPGLWASVQGAKPSKPLQLNPPEGLISVLDGSSSLAVDMVMYMKTRKPCRRRMVAAVMAPLGACRLWEVCRYASCSGRIAHHSAVNRQFHGLQVVPVPVPMAVAVSVPGQ